MKKLLTGSVKIFQEKNLKNEMTTVSSTTLLTRFGNFVGPDKNGEK
jgi:hypothetical protein